jgi:hypothetical protein
MTDLLSCNAATGMLRSVLCSVAVGIDHVENTDIEYSRDIVNVAHMGGNFGRVDASASVPAHDLVLIGPRNKRVEPGGTVTFHITTRVYQEPGPGVTVTFAGIARNVRAYITLGIQGNTKSVAYSVAVSACDDRDSCIDVVALVPVDATRGSEIVLCSAFIANCGMALSIERVMRVIVGFNQEPTHEGRVCAATYAGDIPALVQALDDGCSMQEFDMVRDRCCISNIVEYNLYDGQSLALCTGTRPRDCCPISIAERKYAAAYCSPNWAR